MADLSFASLTPNDNDSPAILAQKQLAAMNTLVASIVAGASLATYAAGTVYSFTNAAALLDFGTTDPSITVVTTGTYLILANVGLKYTAATFAANQTLTVKLRRTNNTAADLTGGSRAITLGIVTLLTAVIETVQLPPVIYAATAGDIIQLYGLVSVAPGAGTVDATSAEIVAVRIA